MPLHSHIRRRAVTRNNKRESMVPLSEDELNQLFDEMVSWNSVLQDTSRGKGLNKPEP